MCVDDSYSEWCLERLAQRIRQGWVFGDIGSTRGLIRWLDSTEELPAKLRATLASQQANTSEPQIAREKGLRDLTRRIQ